MGGCTELYNMYVYARRGRQEQRYRALFDGDDTQSQTCHSHLEAWEDEDDSSESNSDADNDNERTACCVSTTNPSKT